MFAIGFVVGFIIGAVAMWRFIVVILELAGKRDPEIERLYCEIYERLSR